MPLSTLPIKQKMENCCRFSVCCWNSLYFCQFERCFAVCVVFISCLSSDVRTVVVFLYSPAQVCVGGVPVVSELPPLFLIFFYNEFWVKHRQPCVFLLYLNWHVILFLLRVILVASLSACSFFLLPFACMYISLFLFVEPPF